MLATGILALPYRIVRYAWRAWRDARPAARKHGISPWRIVREQVALKRKTGLRPDEYRQRPQGNRGIREWSQVLDRQSFTPR